MTGPEILGLLALLAVGATWFSQDVMHHGWSEAIKDLATALVIGLLAVLALWLLIGYP
jgi:hypothetical protein